jgi:hypothetical protein
MEYQQEEPFTLKVELTYGCNLRCGFCGMNGIKDERRTYDFMEPDTMRRLMAMVRDAEWNPRVELTMRGEPSLHPHREEMVAIVRAHLPGASIMMTSNGGGFLHRDPVEVRNRLVGVFAVGLNILALDDYEHANIVPRLRDAWYAEPTSWIEAYEYPEDADGNPHRRRRPNDHHLVFMKDLTGTTKGTHNVRRINNHCGAAAPLDFSVQKRCAHPFRELAVRWDGRLALCCNDWRGGMVLPTVFEVGDIDQLWNHRALTAVRRMLYHNKRTAGPCAGCTAVSYRTGLLPDKMGKVVLPAPSLADMAAIKDACAPGPLVLPVLRPWEQG